MVYPTKAHTIIIVFILISSIVISLSRLAQSPIIEKAIKLSNEASDIVEKNSDIAFTLDLREGEDLLSLSGTGTIAAKSAQFEFYVQADDQTRTSPTIILDGDTLFISTESLRSIFGTDLFTTDYLSLNLASYQIPTFTYKPEWCGIIEGSLQTLSQDMHNKVRLPTTEKQWRWENSATVTLDSKQLCTLADQIAEAVGHNASQHFINLQGARLNFISAIKQSSVYVKDALAEIIQEQYATAPEKVLEGSLSLIELTNAVRNDAKAWMTENNAALTYSIQKDKGTYTIHISFEYANGSASLQLTANTSSTHTITAPESSLDLEVLLNGMGEDKEIAADDIIVPAQPEIFTDSQMNAKSAGLSGD